MSFFVDLTNQRLTFTHRNDLFPPKRTIFGKRRTRDELEDLTINDFEVLVLIRTLLDLRLQPIYVRIRQTDINGGETSRQGISRYIFGSLLVLERDVVLG
uniref:(northern house mosquito) hypothetical protein n=1 Tax=Culex pipiens TaxID=7175 RepID=A0A8D8L232_CULPI